MICYTVVFIWLDANLGAVSACESAIKAPANWVRITPIQAIIYFYSRQNTFVTLISIQ